MGRDVIECPVDLRSAPSVRTGCAGRGYVMSMMLRDGWQLLDQIYAIMILWFIDPGVAPQPIFAGMARSYKPT